MQSNVALKLLLINYIVQLSALNKGYFFPRKDHIERTSSYEKREHQSKYKVKPNWTAISNIPTQSLPLF